ncbi:hypothetical protein [Aquimarina pacifica]|uniref:hypothetical protein n=1 Tax=Aquimarina pacifica TaxID=1296415 RepID=UPI000472706A|nr:hypothetical protein [Aquimarina pacifica]
MPTPALLEKFIHAVETTPHDTVIEKFYTEDASIQENQNTPRIGKKNLITNEQNMLKKATSVTSACVRPFFINNENVIIRWKFRFEWKDNSVSEIEEIAYQTWKGDKIMAEQFFYDPKQFIPNKKLD